jgi:glycosyltransferase involved in cell wall biosynthesis
MDKAANLCSTLPKRYLRITSSVLLMRVNVTIPAFNEEACLSQSLERLHDYLATQLEMEWEIVVVDNGSTDQTEKIAAYFSQNRSRVQVIHLGEKGRGRALKYVWSNTDAEILSYMDADLSSDLRAFPKLVGALASGQYQVATGSRMLRPALTTRCLKREITSRCYNFLVRAMFKPSFSDAQCGFKAITREAARVLLPQIADDGWFFDTELLILAERTGYGIFDFPVEWVERRESRVRIMETVFEDLKGLARLRRKLIACKSLPGNSLSQKP